MDSADVDIPNEYLCPITLDIMREPMVMPDGQTYEKEAIKMALEKTHVSPLTKMPMKFSDGVINYSLKSLIENFIKEHNIQLDDITEKIKNLNFEENGEAMKIEFEELYARYISKDKSANLCKDSLHVCMRPKKIKQTPPVCLICVVDVSGSMMANCCQKVKNMESMYISRLELIKHSLKTIISTLRKQDMISIIKFHAMAETCVNPTVLINKDTKDSVISKLKEMHVGGATNMWDGIRLAIRTSASIPCKNYQKSIMVFTDGDSNTNPPKGVYETLKETLRSCDDNFTISTFSFGNDVESKLLIDIANLGNGIYGYCPDATMVGTIFINYMANLLSTITPIVKVIVNQGENTKKTMTIGPLYRGTYRNAIFKIDRNLLNETKVTVELPLSNQILDVPFNTETADIQKYIDDKSKSIKQQKVKENNDDDDDDDDDEILDSDSDEEETVDKIENIDPDALIPEKDLKPIDYEEILINQILRNKFIITLNKLTENTNLGSNEQENEKARNTLNKFVELLKQLKYKTKFIKSLIIDIDDPDPNHGQVIKAIDSKYYDTWGRCYLYSFLRFHQFEQCGNFKDQSLQYYSHEVFNVLRKMSNTLFINLPPPEVGVQEPRNRPPMMNIASLPPSNRHGESRPRMRSAGLFGNVRSMMSFRSAPSRDGAVALCRAPEPEDSAPVMMSMSMNAPTRNMMNMSMNAPTRNMMSMSMNAPTRSIMSNFLDKRGGCFNGEAIVSLANGKFKYVKDLKKGDRLNNNAIVQCLIEQRSSNSSKNPYMCNVNGVLFTPYHPICKDNQWYFPIDLVPCKPVNLNSWFNLILNDDIHGKYEVEFENGIKAITLGHYRKENKILEHPYFGTDLVLKDLKERDPSGYSNGYIYIDDIDYRQLQYDDHHCCVNYYKIQAENYNMNNNKNVKESIIIETENNILKYVY